MADNGLAAVNAFMPQVQGLSFPALTSPAATSSTGKMAVPQLVTGDDGLPHTVYIDTQSGQVINNLAGYQVVTASGSTVQVPATQSVPTDTAGTPPAQTTNIYGTHDSSGGGALNAVSGSPSGSGNRGSTNPMNNFGYIDKPGWVGAAGMLPGAAGIIGKAVNLGINAQDQNAVNTARSMVGLPAESTGQQLGGLISNNKGQVSNDAIINGKDYSVGFNALSPTGNTNLTPTEAAKRAAMFGGVQEGVIGKNDPALPSHAPTPFSPDGSNPQPYTPDPTQAQPGAPGSPEQPNTPQTAPTPSVGGGPVTPSTPTGFNDMNYNGAYGPDMGYGWGGTNYPGAGTSTPAPSVAPSTDQSSPSGSIGFGGMNSPAGVTNTSLDGYGGYASPSGNPNGRGYGAYFSNSGPALGNEPDTAAPAANTGFISQDERSNLQDRLGYNPSTYNGPSSITDNQSSDQVSNTVGNSLSPSTHQSIFDGGTPADVGQGVTQAEVSPGFSGLSEQDKTAMAFAGIGELSPEHQAALADSTNPGYATARAELGSFYATMANRAQDPTYGSIPAALTPSQYNSLAQSVTINGQVSHPLANTKAAYAQYGPVALATLNDVAQGAVPGVNYSATNYFNPDAVMPGWAANITNTGMIGQHLFGVDPAFAARTPANVLADNAGWAANNAVKDYQNNLGLQGPAPAWGTFANDPSSGYAYGLGLGAVGPGWGNVAGAASPSQFDSGYSFGSPTRDNQDTANYGGGWSDPSGGAQRDNQNTGAYGGGWGGFADSSSSSSDNGGWGGGRGTDSAGYGGFGGTSSGSDGNNSGTSTGDNGGTNGSGGSAGSQSRSDGWN